MPLDALHAEIARGEMAIMLGMCKIELAAAGSEYKEAARRSRRDSSGAWKTAALGDQGWRGCS